MASCLGHAWDMPGWLRTCFRQSKVEQMINILSVLRRRLRRSCSSNHSNKQNCRLHYWRACLVTIRSVQIQYFLMPSHRELMVDEHIASSCTMAGVHLCTMAGVGYVCSRASILAPNPLPGLWIGGIVDHQSVHTPILGRYCDALSFVNSVTSTKLNLP